MEENTVLVVEDDQDIRESLQFLLADEGYAVVTAEDGQEALDLIPLLPNPAVMLLDFQMPRVDGYGVLLDLAKHPETRDRLSIFLLTANIGLCSPDMVRLLRREGIPVLSKPFDVDHLKAQVHSAFLRLDERHEGEATMVQDASQRRIIDPTSNPDQVPGPDRIPQPELLPTSAPEPIPRPQPEPDPDPMSPSDPPPDPLSPTPTPELQMS